MTLPTWPFTDPENVATFTVAPIMAGDSPILYVCHDEEDGTWQFLTGGELQMEDALLVALKQIVAIDPSVKELWDLPLGWCAQRTHVDAAWVRVACS